jgi:hypothetical protein
VICHYTHTINSLEDKTLFIAGASRRGVYLWARIYLRTSPTVLAAVRMNSDPQSSRRGG